MHKTLIIVPSYNEQDNIVQLINDLFSRYGDTDILIVDDSKDSTPEIVKKEQSAHSNLFLIQRTVKSGRGTAVLEGIRFGLQKDYDFLVEMDADLSHQPKELAQLLVAATVDGVVIGSRYMKGSKILHWPLRRRIFSKFANLYANAILGIGITDYTNGYRVYGREAAAKIEFDKIKSSGYVVLSEIAYQLFLKGVKFSEVPIVFINRREGISNFSWNEIKEAFVSVVRIRRRGLR
jgi:dolichol-phosphate mannosyltransferase